MFLGRNHNCKAVSYELKSKKKLVQNIEFFSRLNNRSDLRKSIMKVIVSKKKVSFFWFSCYFIQFIISFNIFQIGFHHR